MSDIHIAFAYSSRTRTFRARAYVLNEGGWKHSFTMGIGDSADEAKGDAIRWIRNLHEQDGVPAPSTIVDHGKIAGVFVDASMF